MSHEASITSSSSFAPVSSSAIASSSRPPSPRGRSYAANSSEVDIEKQNEVRDRGIHSPGQSYDYHNGETPQTQTQIGTQDDHHSLRQLSHHSRRSEEERSHEQPTLAGSSSSPYKEEGDTIWVDFTPDDPENPFNWPRRRKWFLTILSVWFTLIVANTASAYVPGIDGMEEDLHISSHELSLLGIAIYALGFGLPPLVLAPFSEVFGRRNVYLVSYALYVLFFLCCGFAQNIQTMLIGRFLGGAFGSTGSTLVGGTITDMWRSSDRGMPMALFSVGAIFGTGIGPVWAGYVAQNLSHGWRWIQWIQAIVFGACMLVFIVFLAETRGSVLITRRAQKLRKETGDARYKARAEEERASLTVLITTSLTRPLWLLVSEPIVIAFSLWLALNWLVLYNALSSIELITDLHNYTLGQSGLVFLSICLAAVLGFLANMYQERLYTRYLPTKGPEARLFMSMVSAIIFPVGLFIYAWTSYSTVSIAGPIVGLVIVMFAVYHVYLAAFLYLADAYLIFASSALAAQSFVRNMSGAGTPLFTTQMYQGLGYQWASSLIAFVGILLSPIPFVLFFYGHRIRSKSQFSLRLQELEAERIAREEVAREKGHPNTA